MDDQARLAALLRELRELGIGELFLDGLTAEQAVGLLGRRPALSGGSVRAPAGGAGSLVAPPEGFPGPPAPDATRVARPRRTEAASAAGSTDRPGGSRLQVLAAEAAGCTRCGLAASRTQVVFGRGNATADVVVVGEAPGGEEDRQGLPFVGPAGKLLDLLLLATGFPRDSVYICNVLKCRPPNNRDPQTEEVSACSGWLHGQLEAVQPKVLLAVGKFAGQMLSTSEASISRLRGVVHSYRGIPVVATYHPAYLLRTPAATRATWQDLQLMRKVLDEHD